MYLPPRPSLLPPASARLPLNGLLGDLVEDEGALRLRVPENESIFGSRRRPTGAVAAMRQSPRPPAPGALHPNYVFFLRGSIDFERESSLDVFAKCITTAPQRPRLQAYMPGPCFLLGYLVITS